MNAWLTTLRTSAGGRLISISLRILRPILSFDGVDGAEIGAVIHYYKYSVNYGIYHCARIRLFNKRCRSGEVRQQTLSWPCTPPDINQHFIRWIIAFRVIAFC
jgi:hypothetical protein